MDREISVRVEIIRKMHEKMLNTNDEMAYCRWTYLMPDEPTEEDFIDFATDKEMFLELVEKYMKLEKIYGEF
jgi:hypothetical protein